MGTVEYSRAVDLGTLLKHMMHHLVCNGDAKTNPVDPHRNSIRECQDGGTPNAVQEHVVGDVPGNCVEIPRSIKAGFNLGVPHRILGRDRIKQSTVRGVHAGAKKTTSGHRHHDCDRSLLHHEI